MRRVSLGQPFAGGTADERWRWTEQALREIERASHEGIIDETSVATTDAAGIVTLADTDEVLTGTGTTVAVTPDALAALWEESTGVGWASTLALGEGGVFHVIAGTTNSMNAIDFAVQHDGRRAILIFDATGTLVYSSGLVLPTTGTNISVAAGDCACVVQDSSEVSRVVWYQRADGYALRSSTVALTTYAPTDAEYIVAVAHAGLSAERVIQNSSSITWSMTTAGQISADVVAPLPVARGGTGQITAAEAVGELIQALTESTAPDRTIDMVGVWRSTSDTGAKVSLANVAGMAVLASGTLGSTTALSLALSTLFARFKLYISGAVPAVDNDDANFQVSLDGGGTFASSTASYRWVFRGDSIGVTPNSTAIGDGADGKITIFDTVGSAAGEYIDAEVDISTPHSTAPLSIWWRGYAATGTPTYYSYYGAGAYVNDGPVTHIRFYFQSGNIASMRNYTLVGYE